MNLKPFDSVATLIPINRQRLTLVEPDYDSVSELPAGQVGTIVDMYQSNEGACYLVEFADLQGQEFAMATLQENELLVLHYELTTA